MSDHRDQAVSAPTQLPTNCCCCPSSAGHSKPRASTRSQYRFGFLWRRTSVQSPLTRRRWRCQRVLGRCAAGLLGCMSRRCAQGFKRGRPRRVLLRPRCRQRLALPLYRLRRSQSADQPEGAVDQSRLRGLSWFLQCLGTAGETVNWCRTRPSTNITTIGSIVPRRHM
jgi:hypothetical protein